MTATNYRPCLDHVLRWEGGFVDHPKDPGGATNLGITRTTLQRHRGRHVTAKDVRALQLSEAAEIRAYHGSLGEEEQVCPYLLTCLPTYLRQLGCGGAGMPVLLLT